MSDGTLLFFRTPLRSSRVGRLRKELRPVQMCGLGKWDG